MRYLPIDIVILMIYNVFMNLILISCKILWDILQLKKLLGNSCIGEILNSIKQCGRGDCFMMKI